MALAGFKGTTFEVMTSDGKRWTIAQILRAEKDARDLATNLLASGQHAMVRISAKRDGWETEKVIFEEVGQVSEKPIKPHSVASAPYCESAEDCLRHGARLAIGRVGRAYLDERGITPAEFLVSAGDLMAVERRDTFFTSAVHQLAKAQMKATDKSPGERAQAIFRLHGQLRQQARAKSHEGEALRDVVTEKGLSALPIDGVGEAPSFAALSCLAAIMADGGDWQGRLTKLLDLMEGPGGGSDAAYALVDQLIAELLDGAQAIAEILGGIREGAEACNYITALATGAGQVPRHAHESAHRLHALMGAVHLPATQRVLLERVARVLSGVKPLTEAGGEADRQVFTALVPLLFEPAGIAGGNVVAEAITLRAKMVLGGFEELPMAKAIARLMDLFPNRAVRLGYLLDLVDSPTGQKNLNTVVKALAWLVGQMKSIQNLMPEGTPRATLIAAVDSLRGRLSMGALPEELRGALQASLDRLVRGEAPAEPAAPAAPAKPAKPAADPDAPPADADGREVLFEEGDEGDKAYLISEGSVEIFRVRGGEEEIVATLGRGELFGEMSLIDNHPRAASARSLPGTKLMIISQEILQKRLAALEESDRVMKLLMETLVRRLRGQSQV